MPCFILWGFFSCWKISFLKFSEKFSAFWKFWDPLDLMHGISRRKHRLVITKIFVWPLFQKASFWNISEKIILITLFHIHIIRTESKATNTDKKRNWKLFYLIDRFTLTVVPHIISGTTSVKYTKILSKNVITTSPLVGDY